MDISGKFVVAAVTHDETRIWGTDAKKNTPPEIVMRPNADHVHHHVRQGQKLHERDAHRFDVQYFEGISLAIAPAAQILLVGHGKGKSNSMVQIIQYLERHYPATAKKVVGALDVNVKSLTEPQILSAARRWFDEHKNG